MGWRRFFAAAIVVLVCTSACASPPQGQSAARHETSGEVVVRAIYALGLSASPGAPARGRVPMTPELIALSDQALAGADGEVLDADPVFDANDPGQPQNLVVTQDPAQGGHVTVTARFSQNGSPTVIYYALVARDGHLLVDNIRSGRGANLRADLERALEVERAHPPH